LGFSAAAPAAIREIARVAQSARHSGAQKIRVQRQDHVGAIEAVNGIERLAERRHRSGARRCRPQGSYWCHLAFRQRRQQVLNLGAQASAK